jgi:hypothetical protein
MDLYAKSSIASPNTPGSVSIYSRGSYHFLRTANSSDSFMLRKKSKNSHSLPVLVGNIPKKFKLNSQYYETKPLLMINKRLPDKKVNVPVILNKNDDWRTDDIHMNMLHLKLQKRRRDKLEQMTKVMNSLQKELKSRKTASSRSRSKYSRSTRSSSNTNNQSRNYGNTTPYSVVSSDALARAQPQYEEQFMPPVDFSIPSGLQPKYHISSPKFVGIHPWSKTTSASFIPHQIVHKVNNNYSDQLPPFTAGFANNVDNRLGAFYTRRAQRNATGSSGKLRLVTTPIKFRNDTKRTTLSEDDNTIVTDRNASENSIVPTMNTNIGSMETKTIEIRTLKSGKTGLFSGDDQILPVDDSRTIDSWKWGMQ